MVDVTNATAAAFVVVGRRTFLVGLTVVEDVKMMVRQCCCCCCRRIIIVVCQVFGVYKSRIIFLFEYIYCGILLLCVLLQSEESEFYDL